MAPGLTRIISFEGNINAYIPNDILNTMAASNMVKNLSSSWGWSGGPSTTTDAIFQQMAADGQSYFTASGDRDAFTVGASSVNGVESSSRYPQFVHAGRYGAFLGDTTLATLSQSLATQPGQMYFLSLWLDNPVAGSGEIFQVRWITNGTVTTLFAITNPPAMAWTNLQFFVTAAGTNSTLQFAAENQPDAFGLDDVQATPLPGAAFLPLTRGTNQVTLAWGAATNVLYQVQVSTNLFQTNWVNLGGGFTAATSFLSLIDTNVPPPHGGRFYRLIVNP